MLDAGWKSVGCAAEIISSVSEKYSTELKSNPIRICLPDSHTPMSKNLEESYYFNEEKIVSRILEVIKP